MNDILLITLALAASVSPLLTLVHLWQLKEWRWDRLLDHLRAEGWLLQLWGKTRTALLFCFSFLLVTRLLAPLPWAFLTLGMLILLSLAQIALRRQPVPVWTRKATALTVGAVALTLLTGLLLWWSLSSWVFAATVPLLILLEPFTLALSRILLSPLDRVLKKRIMDRARALREAHLGLTVIGITGSVGKTTTKELLCCLLQDLGARATPAHVNTEMGVSQWLIEVLRHREKTPPSPEGGGGLGGEGPLIIEMGAYRPGEIALLCSIVKPVIGVLTHIGTQHIALFGSQEALFRAKSELLAHLPSSGRAFLNGDNEWVRRMRQLAPCPVTMVSTDGSGDLSASAIEEIPTGLRFSACGAVFTVPIHGTQNVTNILLVIAIARHLGIPLARIQELLKTYRHPDQTFTVRSESEVTILDDTHNSSEASVKAAIAWARNQPAGGKILLMSGLIELGEMEEPVHASLGAMASSVFQRVIFMHERGAVAFGQGMGRPVERFSKGTPPIAPGSLLVCCGRMPPSSMQRMLPVFSREITDA